MPLRVVLAGYNLDTTFLAEVRALLDDLARAHLPPEGAGLQERARELLGPGNWTPETISAAYARISRDPREVGELRAEARAEVARARRSNQAIIFDLGHSSVAEHAVFNFDILGLSRLAVETLERQRLASYTEKSQRYILLEEDWALPEEIRGHPVEALFRTTLARQNEFYRRAYQLLLPHIQARHPELGESPKDRRTLEGLAKEDARYALSLATTVQLGETINARNLEKLIHTCRAHALDEVRRLGEALASAVTGLAPSLLRYTAPTAYQKKGPSALHLAVKRLSALEGRGASESAAPGPPSMSPAGDDPGVRLLSVTPDADGAIAAALLFSGGFGSLGECQARAREMGPSERRELLLSALREIAAYDALPREYETVELVFELIISASCFAQLKRHRMATLIPGDYDPELGVTVPPVYDEVGLTRPFLDLVEDSDRCARAISDSFPPVMAYALTNAHRRRLLFKVNARELIHMSRLRMDAHAQWDIRRVVARMVELGREIMPLTLLLAAGKDRLLDRKREIWG